MGHTTRIIHGHHVRMNLGEQRVLCGMNLCYAVVIKKDVSVRVVGAVESVHKMSGDAQKEADRLSAAYDTPGAFVVVDLDHIPAIPLKDKADG